MPFKVQESFRTDLELMIILAGQQVHFIAQDFGIFIQLQSPEWNCE